MIGGGQVFNFAAIGNVREPTAGFADVAEVEAQGKYAALGQRLGQKNQLRAILSDSMPWQRITPPAGLPPCGWCRTPARVSPRELENEMRSSSTIRTRLT